MNTNNGITKKDWDRVIALSADIANITAIDEDASEATVLLLNEIQRLKKKYGRVPSLLATQAEYSAPKLKCKLLKEAYITADELNDRQNKAYISSTMLEDYIEQDAPEDLKLFWFSKFLSDIKLYSDEYLEQLLTEFSEYFEDK